MVVLYFKHFRIFWFYGKVSQRSSGGSQIIYLLCFCEQCRTFQRTSVGGVFESHKGQVTRVAWRTVGDEANSIFLSASLDETIRVWHVDKPHPICTLRLIQVGWAFCTSLCAPSVFLTFHPYLACVASSSWVGPTYLTVYIAYVTTVACGFHTYIFSLQ